MKIEDYIQFARANPVCSLATVEGSQPHVRTVLLWFADDTGFYFVLLSPKKVSAQLKANPRAEVCFCSHPTDLVQTRQMRVTGRMELVTSPELQARARQDRAFLSQLAGRPVDDLIEVFRLTDCDAHFWVMRDILHEPALEHVAI
ncbi:MAG TPA: pyridoxamine 5'-phosphate oxidase family protein [Lacunisphaera sp.]|nr:pyridoxamine 5'-phosphate oxidase family protein [Lacunisphaera sp.]